MPIALALVLHAHQPAGNFDSIIEETYRTSYRPFLHAAEARPSLKFNFHFSGYLLDWLVKAHPGYVARLRRLHAANRVELLSGGYFEPILAVIPAEDQQEQIRRLSVTLDRHFHQYPDPAPRPYPSIPLGAWLAERVWEPEMAAVLVRAGIGYTLLDDSHFAAAGVAADDLHGYWWTESQGQAVRVVPSNYSLRQTMPFRPVAESIEFLRQAATRHPGSLLTMGDDLEKFGSWPGTSTHVYGGDETAGWLAEFLDSVEKHADEIETVCLGAYLSRHPARGLIYLPTGSYPEMMAWAGNPSWRGFFTKYREANLLHKSQWDITRRCRALPTGIPSPAREHILAAEANDVYWHGWFGGLYSPHLRNLAFTHLIEADRELRPPSDSVRRWDLHGDGTESIELRTPRLRILVTPAGGGAIEEIDFLPAAANCVNSLQRRPEAYHQALRENIDHNPAHLPSAANSPLATEHDRDLARLLVYDRYPRSCGRVYVCPTGTHAHDLVQDLPKLQIEADFGAAGGVYTVHDIGKGRIELQAADLVKQIQTNGDDLTVTLKSTGGAAVGRDAVIEMVFNLLAPDAEDRYWESQHQRHNLRWRGALSPAPLRLWDGWRRFGLVLDAPAAAGWWVEPLYTVSQSEHGFEAIYQGSSVCAYWPAGWRRLELGVKFFL